MAERRALVVANGTPSPEALIPHAITKREPGVMLHLFHGRTDPRAAMNGWGSDGPTIGPLHYVHTTYGSDLKYRFIDAADAVKFEMDDEGDLTINEHGCIEYKGVHYGDWSVSAEFHDR